MFLLWVQIKVIPSLYLTYFVPQLGNGIYTYTWRFEHIEVGSQILLKKYFQKKLTMTTLLQRSGAMTTSGDWNAPTNIVKTALSA